MRVTTGLGEHPTGARTGKLLADPAVWYPVNAAIDGIDVGSDSPIDRMKFMVYQHRLGIEALKTKALLLAALQSPEVGKAAEAYLNLAVPMALGTQALELARKERQMGAFLKMGPIKAGDIKATGAPSLPPSSMHRPDRR